MDEMIKGAQKRIVVVRTGDSGIFEEALFVLRKESGAGEDDMVAEAVRIIGDCRVGGGRKAELSLKRALLALACFFCGSALGGALVAAVFLLS